MNICIVSMPRSGTEYLFGMLHQIPNISVSISEPFHPAQIFNIDNDYVIGARKQLEIIKQLSLTNKLLLKEIYIPDIRLQLPAIQKDGTPINLSENIELFDIFDEYRTLIENNFYKIKLVRNDIFEMALSTCIALEIGQWHNAKMSSTKITIQLGAFTETVHRYKLIYNSLINYPGCQETISYEELSGNYLIDSHLVKCIKSPIDPAKQSIFKNLNKRSVVINYDEILKAYSNIL